MGRLLMRAGLTLATVGLLGSTQAATAWADGANTSTNITPPTVTRTLQLGPNITCTVTQTPAGHAAVFVGTVEEDGSTTSTSDCNSTLVTRLTSQTIVSDLSPLHPQTTYGAVASGSGFGPVVGSVSQTEPITNLAGVEIQFTFITVATYNDGSSQRICQKYTFSEVPQLDTVQSC